MWCWYSRENQNAVLPFFLWQSVCADLAHTALRILTNTPPRNTPHSPQDGLHVPPSQCPLLPASHHHPSVSCTCPRLPAVAVVVVFTAQFACPFSCGWESGCFPFLTSEISPLSLRLDVGFNCSLLLASAQEGSRDGGGTVWLGDCGGARGAVSFASTPAACRALGACSLVAAILLVSCAHHAFPVGGIRS